jgi:hypothetical protein
MNSRRVTGRCLPQQPEKLPVVGFVSSRSLDGSARQAAAFTKGLSELGYVEGQNVAVEYHWLMNRREFITLPPSRCPGLARAAATLRMRAGCALSRISPDALLTQSAERTRHLMLLRILMDVEWAATKTTVSLSAAVTMTITPPRIE